MSSKPDELLLEAVSPSARDVTVGEVWAWMGGDVYLLIEVELTEVKLLNLCNGVVYDAYPMYSFKNNMGAPTDGWQRIA